MTKTMRNVLFLIPLWLVCIGCQNEARWYPTADVLIGNHSEYTDAMGGHGLAVTVVVHNTGKTSILSGAITVKVTTNKREYLQTVGSANKIIPGGKIALPVSVAYLEADEQLQNGGISVYDSYFD